ncbi:hypothetical protein LJC04_03035 [Ruminococcaceae bacterium OttesenSCG-928-O06]|nr:hypothetical protein [Ruminococcaceae bacterium OttesenSCG-928-O06]
MLQESIAVLLVGVLLVVVFVRSKHYGYALAVLPVGFIPVAHLLIRSILYLAKNSFFGVRPAVVTAFADVVGLAVSVVFVMLFSTRIQAARNRKLYIVVMLAYLVLLGWAYIYNALHVLLV